MLDRDTFILDLFHREYEALCRLAYRLTGSAELAQDLTQDTFLLALSHAGELADHPSPGGWLTLTLYNLVLNERRRTQRRPQVSIEEAQELFSSQEPPLENMLPKQLSPEDRQLLLWRFERQLKTGEIALLLGISEAACRKRLSRVLQKCRALLERDGTAPPARREEKDEIF